jgi:predicted amidophosphoribosyltransferase
MKSSPEERTRCSECGNSIQKASSFCEQCERFNAYRRELSGNAQFGVWQRYLMGSSMDGIRRWKDQDRKEKRRRK